MSICLSTCLSSDCLMSTVLCPVHLSVHLSVFFTSVCLLSTFLSPVHLSVFLTSVCPLLASAFTVELSPVCSWRRRLMGCRHKSSWRKTLGWWRSDNLCFYLKSRRSKEQRERRDRNRRGRNTPSWWSSWILPSLPSGWRQTPSAGRRPELNKTPDTRAGGSLTCFWPMFCSWVYLETIMILYSIS